MEERKYLVYKHTSPSGKVYIGMTKQTAEGRWKKGFGYQSSPHFWNAIQKYGWDNFSHEVLHKELSADDACELEQKLIAEYNAMDRQFGYNEKSGGQIGAVFSDSVRKKISDAQKRFHKEHPDAALKIAERVRGFRHTEETKRKMSEIASGRHCDHTDEWNKKIGESNRARLLSDENLYRDACNRCRANGLKAAKPVEQLDLLGNVIARYESAHDAERKTGIRNGNIANCCVGKGKTSGGYKWRYAIDNSCGREIAQ